jgi:HlyD family secretion protein
MDIQRPDVKKRRAQRLAAAAVAGAAFLLLAAFAWSLATRPPAVDRDGLWSAQVTRGELVHEISAAGSLVAPELRAVTNRSEGVVERILVLPGHVVEADDVLLEMSSPQLEDDLDSAEWDLDAARAEQKLLRVELENAYLDVVAQLANAEAEYTNARLELDAQEELGRQQIASQLEVQRARLRTEQWRKRLDAEQARLDRFDDFRAAQEAAADARLSQLHQQVSRLQARVDDLHVRAGIGGVVREINVQEGERLTQGQAVARIVNPRNLIARVGVSERDASRVQSGLPVRVEMGRDTVAGKVTRIDPTVRDRLVTIDVALVGEQSPALRPDLSVTARIELERVGDALILDRPVGLRSGNETLELFRLVGDGARAERVTVEVGRASARQVEILRGLDAGDRVILADMSDWLGESVVRIR